MRRRWFIRACVVLLCGCSADEHSRSHSGSGEGGRIDDGGNVSAGGMNGKGGKADGSGGSSAAGRQSSSDSGPNERDGGSDPFAACGGHIVDGVTGAVDREEYARQARLWDRATIDCRLGPKYADLPHSSDGELPVAYESPHMKAPNGYLCPTYELSGSCSGNCDYGSTSGQVLYAPDDARGTGVDRIQNYGYENGVICESVLTGSWLGGPHPDPGLVAWASALGRSVTVPNGFSQTEFWETNAGIMTFPDGLVGATGNQTAGDTKPHFELPPNKVPTAVAVSTYNEFAFVTVWDTDAVKGEIAVFALRADKPEAFSIPYFGLPNEGGFSAIHLMGYVELPDMKTPTAIAMSGDNGNTPGGHVPGFEYGSQTDPTKNILTSADARTALEREDGERRVAMSGQIVVLSRWENEVTFLDARPLAQFVRDVYFGPDDAKRTAAGAKEAWPFTFDDVPTARPIVVTTLSVPSPTVVRVGNQGNPNEQGLKKPLKAWVGNLDGDVRILDVSSFAYDASRPIPASTITELASVRAGSSLTSMTRSGPDAVVVASRADRSIEWVGIAADDQKTLEIVRTLVDSRFEDPVVADLSDRGPVVTVGDFTGKKLLNYRYGPTEANGGKPPSNYGCGPGGTESDCNSFEFGGSLAIPGTPFFVGTTNVN
ncbi:MAG TPA: hypothetical protein VHU80_06765 [Polyangiaceae bacterium]|nr:hypothetical protein [Polyangiaceae bacterium]